MRFPDFIVIGTQKSATKWLYDNLICHPHIFLPPGGGREVHYLDSTHYGDTKWWADHFYPTGQERISGDITPDYAYVDIDRIRHCYKYAPRAKILYTLRNPKDRVVSALRMAHKKTLDGYKGEPLGPQIDLNGSLSHLVDFCEKGEGWLHSNYITNLKNWRSVYSDIRIFSYDFLSKRPYEYLRRVMNYIDVPIPKTFDNYPVEIREHVSTKYPIPKDLYIEIDRIYNPMIEIMSYGLPFSVEKWLDPISNDLEIF